LYVGFLNCAILHLKFIHSKKSISCKVTVWNKAASVYYIFNFVWANQEFIT